MIPTTLTSILKLKILIWKIRSLTLKMATIWTRPTLVISSKSLIEAISRKNAIFIYIYLFV